MAVRKRQAYYLLIFILLIKKDLAAEYKGCYKDSVENPSFFTCATSTEYDEMTPDLCITTCAKDGDHYAALGYGKICLCASNMDNVESSEDCNSSCTGDPTVMCGGNEDIYSVYEVDDEDKSTTPVFSLSTKQSEAKLDEPVIFELTKTKGKDLSYVFYYGDDGLSSVIPNATKMSEFCYHYPGTFYASVESTKKTEVTSDFTQITVEASPIEVELLCPQNAATHTSVICNISLTIGSSMEATIDAGDGSEEITVSLPDLSTSTIGNPVPQIELPSSGEEPSDSSNYIFFKNGVVTEKGIIYGFEKNMISDDKVDFEILVLKRKCNSDEEFCMLGGQCASKCPVETNQLDSTCGQCSPNDEKEENFEERIKVSYEVSKGYEYHPIDTKIEVYPGDIIGFKCAGNIAYRAREGMEESDFSSSSFDPLEKEETDRKHFVRFFVTSQLDIEMDKTYTKPGNFTYTITLNGSGFSEPSVKTAEIGIRTPIEDLKLTSDVKIVKVDEDITLDATMKSGSLVTLVWKIQDDTEESETHEDVADKTFKKTKSFPSEGEYSVLLIASNEISSENDTITVIVEYPVNEEDWSVNTDSPTLYEPGDLNLKVEFSGSHYPTNATMLIDWGDNNDPQKISLEKKKLINEVTHQYKGPGNYTVSVTISNQVSSFPSERKIEIMEEILGLKVSTKYTSNYQKSPKKGYSESQIVYPVDSTIHFKPECDQGTIHGYIMEFENGTFMQNFTFDEELKYMMNQSGRYRIVVYAHNPAQGRSDPYTVVLEITDTIHMFYLEDIETHDQNEEKQFKLTFNETVEASWLIVDYGDGCQREVYGDKSLCKEKEPDLPYKGAMSETMYLKHTYTERGVFEMKIKACNMMSCAEKEYTISIGPIKCSEAKAYVDNEFPDARFPEIQMRSQLIKFLTDTVIKCNVTVKISKRWWTIFEIDPDNFDVKREIQLEDQVDSWNKSFLALDRRFLDYGLYKVIYSSIFISEEFEDVILQFATRTYIRIVKSPLKPVITEYSQSELKRGYGQEVFLDPQIQSIDPDFPDDKNFSVEWFCHQMEPKAETLKVEDPNSDPRKNKVDILSATGDHQGQDSGGCFGTGPGMVNLQNGTWQLNTKSFYRSNALYKITAVIYKDDRSGIVSIRIRVVDGVFPIVKIRCLPTELCFITEKGLIVSATRRLALIMVDDEDCVDDDFVYQWTTFIDRGSYENREKIPHDKLEDLSEGMKHSELFLYKEIFSVDTEDVHYAFQLSATCKGQEGVAELEVRVSRPPAGGTCTLEESKESEHKGEKSLLSKFEIICHGWRQAEGYQIQKYDYYYEFNSFRDESISKRTHLQISPNHKSEVYLPCGLISLQVEITDEFDSATVFFIINTTLNIPSWEEFNSFLQSDWLLELKNTGQQYWILQTYNAINSMKFCGPEEPKPEGYDEMTDEEKKKYEEEKLRERSNFISSAIDSLSELTLQDSDDVFLVSSIMMDILGTGHEVDILTMDKAVGILQMFQDVLEKDEDSDPSDLCRMLESLSEIMSAIFVAQTDVNRNERILPTDLDNVNDLEYDVDIEENFVMPSSKEGVLRSGIISSQKYMTPNQIKMMDDLKDGLKSRLLKNIAINEDRYFVESPLVSAVFFAEDKSENEPRNFDLNGAKISLPDNCILLSVDTEDCTNDTVNRISVFVWEQIYNAHGKNLHFLAPDTKTVSIDVNDEDNVEVDVNNLAFPIDIVIPRSERENPNGFEPEMVLVHPQLKWFEYMMYHRISIDIPHSAMTIFFQSEQNKRNHLVYIRFHKKPTLTAHDFVINLQDLEPENGRFTVFLDTKAIQNRTGYVYIGIAEVVEGININLKENVSSDLIVNNGSSNYSIFVFNSCCPYFDEYLTAWMTEGCWVVSVSLAEVHCQCNHLTTFANGFLIQPNTIDFTYVFANANFADNMTIYCAIIVTFSLYIVILIYARRKDKQDVTKLGALPLPDNKETDKYIYEILVLTGHKRNASTKSQVSFILTGELEETETRTFGRAPRKIFEKDNVDIFVMAVPRPLGQLQFLNIWHDNSGSGGSASWYLGYVVVRDVQTGEKFEFIVNRWLALEYDDGQINRVIPVAGKEQLIEFNHLFKTATHKSLSDEHLWFSVFLRPARSRFTRCQRVSSCMALLYLSMLANAMWYGTVPDKPSNPFSVGPFSVGLEQISIGFFSNLIIFPPSFLIIFLFRKSRPRKLRPSRINEALKKQNHSVTRDDLNQCDNADQKTGIDKKFERKKRFTLPWWCVLLGWILCVGCLLVSIFFLWAYGIQFGNEKTKKWITSLVISFFTSVLLTQPIKVFLVSAVISSICKKVEVDDDDADDDEEDPQLKQDEEFLIGKRKKPSKNSFFPKSDVMEKAKLDRIKELEMWKIIREIIIYLIFLWILSVIGYGARDPNAFYMYKNLQLNFVNLDKPMDFLQVTTTEQMWNWVHNIFLPRIRAQRNYNNNPPFGRRGFLKDEVNRMLGYAIVRQLRIKPGSCQIPALMTEFFVNCSGNTRGFQSEDKTNYGQNWTNIDTKTKTKSLKEDRDFYEPYEYKTWQEMEGTLIKGKLDIYGGGGYVVPLTGSLSSVKARMRRLEKEGWIDKYTRAIFFEFSVFNANVNLFGIVQIFAEFFPGGGIHPSYYVHTFRMFNFSNGMGMFLCFCQFIFLMFIVCSTVRELKHICKQGCSYFTEFWNLIEMLVICISYPALTIFIVRTVLLHRALHIFNETKGNKYINIYFIYQIDELYCHLISIVIFLCIIKFNKLLRFNKRMSSLASTLRRCSDDLKGFGVMFLIFFMAYGSMFYLIFSRFLTDFETYLSSIETLFSILLNKFNFEEYMNTHATLGPLMFFVFSLSTNLIILNVFMSIIIRSFEDVKSELAKRENDYEIVNFIFNRIRMLVGFKNSTSTSSEEQVEKEKDKADTSVTEEFPEKVDLLLKYINDMYFEGKMDLNNKALLRMYRRKKINFIPPPGSLREPNQNIFYSS